MPRWMALLFVLLMTGCAARPAGLVVAGSTSVQPLAEVLAEGLVRSGGPAVTVQGGGSTAGVQAVLKGVAGLGAVSRRLTAAETREGLVEHIIAYDVLAIVVHPDNPVPRLSLEQVRALFSGRVRDWSALGGTPGPVYLVSREAGSGSREAFRNLVGPISPGAIVQGSSGAIRAAVMKNPRAVGYVSFGVARMGGLKVMAVAERRPGGPGYPLVRPLALVTAGPARGAAAEYIRFALGPAGQALVRAEGLLPP